MKKYEVTMRFKHPAWDEKDGITIEVSADSKSEACRYARREMDDAGHCGRRYFKAVEIESDVDDVVSSESYDDANYWNETNEIKLFS